MTPLDVLVQGLVAFCLLGVGFIVGWLRGQDAAWAEQDELMADAYIKAVDEDGSILHAIAKRESER